MVSSEMLRRVVLVRTDVSEELNASFIRVTRIGELGTTLAVTSYRHTVRRNTLMKEALSSSETSALTRATRRNIPEDDILRSHRRENLKSYILYHGLRISNDTVAGAEGDNSIEFGSSVECIGFCQWCMTFRITVCGFL
jgi:hypothetical protein